MIRSLLMFALYAVGAYVALLALVYVTQSRQLYFPTRELVTTPATYEMRYEDVHVVTEDGVRLHGWFVPADAPRGTLLFFHGNAGNISHRLESIRIFRDLGLSVFILGYRGYGQSEGRPDEHGTYLDALAGWQYLREQRGLEPQEIVFFGRSLGAAVAAWLAARHRPGAVILESAFTSAPDLGAELFPWLPVRRILKYEYDTRAALARNHAPLLIVHSRDDEIVPFHHADTLLSSANEPKTLLEISGGHNDGFLRSGARYQEGLRRFLDAHLGY